MLQNLDLRSKLDIFKNNFIGQSLLNQIFTREQARLITLHVDQIIGDLHITQLWSDARAVERTAVPLFPSISFSDATEKPGHKMRLEGRKHAMSKPNCHCEGSVYWKHGIRAGLLAQGHDRLHIEIETCIPVMKIQALHSYDYLVCQSNQLDLETQSHESPLRRYSDRSRNFMIRRLPIAATAWCISLLNEIGTLQSDVRVCMRRCHFTLSMQWIPYPRSVFYLQLQVA